jgi:hypothetical protein
LAQAGSKIKFFLNFNNDFYNYFAKSVKKNFFESLISITRIKQKTLFVTIVENFDEKRSRSPKNKLKGPFEHFCSGGPNLPRMG